LCKVIFLPEPFSNFRDFHKRRGGSEGAMERSKEEEGGSEGARERCGEWESGRVGEWEN